MNPNRSCAFSFARSIVPCLPWWGAALAIALLLLLPQRLLAPPLLERDKPEALGLSSEGLKSITNHLSEQVDAGKIAGAVGMLVRHGRIGYFEAVGDRDAEAGKPMKRDTIFRIASMTKPITTAAVMMLAEEGKLSLSDPLADYIPDFKNPRVLVAAEGGSIETVGATRAITIHDLLTHTSGIIYGWLGPETLNGLYREEGISGDLFLPYQENETIGDRVEELADVPLKFQPGSAWSYGLSLDVLGRVVEVVSGLTLEQFFQERVFRPLKMKDTDFFVPGPKRTRLAALYTPGEGGRIRRVGSEPVTAGALTFSEDYCYAGGKRFFSGGGGLTSTATDYARFLQMLLNMGLLDGERILERSSVERMTQNQIGDLRIPFGGHGDGFGYGFGVLTQRGRADDVASVGTYSWGGIFNTYFWVDPREEVIGILMTQVYPYNHLDIRSEFKRLAYEAINDSGFRREYWYEKGLKHGNPYFNGRQLRVNAPETSLHPSFGGRSEARSSGMARIQVDEDLREIQGAELYCEIWGGHPGTANKRVIVNGRNRYRLPEVGTAAKNSTHQYPCFNLPMTDLVNGYNSLQFACDQGSTFWGHYIVDNVALKLGLPTDHPDLEEAGLAGFDVRVRAESEPENELIDLKLAGSPGDFQKIATVHYQGRYFGYDENGNRRQSDWHGMTKGREPYAMLGSSKKAPFKIEWGLAMLPAQKRMEVRALISFKENPGLTFVTRRLRSLEVPEREEHRVVLHEPEELPHPFWSRAGRKKECVIRIDRSPASIEAAELHVVAWTGGAGDVEDYFRLNGHPLPVAEGSGHEVLYSRMKVDPSILKRGANRIELLSDTEHHGIEILLPGPALMVRSEATKALGESQ